MATSAAAVWEARPGSGSATNGGFFVPGSSGTDYSQQNSAQYALTGVTSAGSGNTVLTAAAAADMVGNGARTVSGTNFVVDIYQVLSVVVGVSITFATNNAGTSICSGVGAAGVINIGGALDSIASINTRVINSTTQGSNGNTIYFKATGTLAFTATQLNFDLKSYALIGYTTTRGDNGQATITTATNSVFLFEAGNAGVQWQFYNIKMTSTASTKAAAIEDGNSIYYLLCQNCTFDGPKYALETTVTTHHVAFFNCEIKNCSNHGMNLEQVATKVVGCYIHDNTGDGIHTNGTANGGISGELTVINSVIKSNGGNGITLSDSDGNAAISLCLESSAIINNTGDGIKAGGTSFSQMLGLINNIIDSNGGWGINCGALTSLLVFPYGGSNAFGSGSTANTSGNRNNFPALSGDITLTADPFTNRSGADFSLNSTSGGGTACKGAGFPGILIAGGTGHSDIGPLQSNGSTTVNTIVVSPTYTRFVVEEL
jgi:hypothetical protein